MSDNFHDFNDAKIETENDNITSQFKLVELHDIEQEKLETTSDKVLRRKFIQPVIECPKFYESSKSLFNEINKNINANNAITDDEKISNTNKRLEKTLDEQCDDYLKSDNDIDMPVRPSDFY